MTRSIPVDDLVDSTAMPLHDLEVEGFYASRVLLDGPGGILGKAVDRAEVPPPAVVHQIDLDGAHDVPPGRDEDPVIAVLSGRVVGGQVG